MVPSGVEGVHADASAEGPPRSEVGEVRPGGMPRVADQERHSQPLEWVNVARTGQPGDSRRRIHPRQARGTRPRHAPSKLI